MNRRSKTFLIMSQKIRIDKLNTTQRKQCGRFNKEKCI
jgi:hypothetical protein